MCKLTNSTYSYAAGRRPVAHTIHPFIQPGSIMKNLFSLCLTAISLAGFANLGFAERYSQLAVQTSDTSPMDHNTAKSYREYSPTLSVNDGEVAYIIGSFAEPKNEATFEYGNFNPSNESKALIELVVDYDKLDDNTTYAINSTFAIPGPCILRLAIRPAFKRAGLNYSGSNENYPDNSAHGNWDFGASHGSASIRITGSAQEASKKFATVIPENSPGNVNIILEQSTDLINWSAVNPGSFAPSASKRFFRVRAQE